VQIRQIADRLRQSLWFIPGLGLAVAALAAAAMLLLSQWITSVNGHPPIIFGGGPEGARGILQAIAGSVVTVAGVVFSITVVALQLTSTQYSPRVLRNFMRDRPTQLTLGVFMGTIFYSLLVLRTVRSTGDNGEEAFVPGFAVTGAVVLVSISLLMLIYFIHHIGSRIQVSSIIESVANETMGTAASVERLFEPMPESAVAGALVLHAPRPVRARRSGYLQYVDIGGLLRIAREHDLRVGMVVPPGGWVQAGAPLFEVDGDGGAADEDLQDWLVGRAGLGSQRSMQQDVGFGVQQLVDIGVRALSPGVNDPTTATQCIDRLTQVLVALGEREPWPVALADEEGTPRLSLAFPGFRELLQQAFEQVRHYGAGAPVVVRHLALALRILRQSLPPRCHEDIRHEAQLLEQDVRALDTHDRGEIEPLLRQITRR
jgi:uncharacterized membrane protein